MMGRIFVGRKKKNIIAIKSREYIFSVFIHFFLTSSTTNSKCCCTLFTVIHQLRLKQIVLGRSKLNKFSFNAFFSSISYFFHSGYSSVRRLNVSGIQGKMKWVYSVSHHDISTSREKVNSSLIFKLKTLSRYLTLNWKKIKNPTQNLYFISPLDCSRNLIDGSPHLPRHSDQR